MAGFIGRTAEGVITTLGRNGSDYSASVIGAALDCVEVSIYSDVDGVLTADPRLVMNARLLARLTYAEAARLSWFGAKVLHPRTLIPIAQRHIPVRVRNTFNPHGRGTLIGPDGRQPGGAAAITRPPPPRADHRRKRRSVRRAGKRRAGLRAGRSRRCRARCHLLIVWPAPLVRRRGAGSRRPSSRCCNMR